MKGHWRKISKGKKRKWVQDTSIDALSMGQGIVEGGIGLKPFTYDEIPLPDSTLLVHHGGTS